MVIDWWSFSRLPLAWSTVALASAVRTSSSAMPCEASAAGLACTRTAKSCWPATSTCDTPVTAEIFCARMVKA